MNRLFLDRKAGFRITRPEQPVIIRDSRGILFYTNEDKIPNVTEFNLPAGVYFVDKGFFRQIPNPINYPLIPLPVKERNRPIPKDFRIIYGNNPNKCSVIWPHVDPLTGKKQPGKVIVFDESLREWPKADQDFILFHEYSHAHYKTEKYCDLKAVNYMIVKGYNPIQIGLSQIDSLSDAQRERKEFVINAIIKTYGGKYL